MLIITIILLFSISFLGAITVTDSQGVSSSFTYEELAEIPRQEFTTTRVKDGETRSDTWQGFRFDNWLEQFVDKPFSVIRFESPDRYMVSLSKAEFDTLACWLVFASSEEVFPEGSMRVIFPALRDMKWVRDLDRVVLEDFDPLKMPVRFEFLDERLKQETLLDDPAPFTNTKGYYFADLLPLSSRAESFNVVLYSQDGMKLSLEYPLHLEGAILEATDDGLNLKSPQIPGGMWLKNIIYIQIDEFALIHTGNLDALIALNRIMDWKLSPEVHFILHKSGVKEKIPLNDLLAHPELLAEVESFELIP